MFFLIESWPGWVGNAPSPISLLESLPPPRRPLDCEGTYLPRSWGMLVWCNLKKTPQKCLNVLITLSWCWTLLANFPEDVLQINQNMSRTTAVKQGFHVFDVQLPHLRWLLRILHSRHSIPQQVSPETTLASSHGAYCCWSKLNRCLSAVLLGCTRFTFIKIHQNSTHSRDRFWYHLWNAEAFHEGLWGQQWNKHEPRRRSWQHLVERASTPHPWDQTSAMLDGHGIMMISWDNGCDILALVDVLGLQYLEL